MVLTQDGASLFIYPQPNGIYYSYTWYVDEYEQFEGLSREQLLSFVKKHTDSWADWMVTLIQASCEQTMGFRAYYDKRPAKQVHFDDTWLIGDAAHPMSPFRGLGANLAMQDASQLAQYLLSLPINKRDKKNANAVEKRLVKAGANAIKQSRRNTYSLHNKTWFSFYKRRSLFALYRLLMKFAPQPN